MAQLLAMAWPDAPPPLHSVWPLLDSGRAPGTRDERAVRHIAMAQLLQQRAHDVRRQLSQPWLLLFLLLTIHRCALVCGCVATTG